MAQQTTADGGRTDTERFEDDVSGDELAEGDQIDPALVAPGLSMVGQPSDRDQAPEVDQKREYQLARVTAIDRMDDVHSALLLDPETGTFVRAGRHDSQQAWTQSEADWTVREVGEKVVVDDVHDLERPEEERDEDADDYVATWVDVLFGDLAAGYDDYDDERELDSGSTLRLRDPDGRKALASISVVGGEEDE